MTRKLCEALAANAVAIDRLRRAVFGLDRHDRLEIAKHLAAEHGALKRSHRGKPRSRAVRSA